MARVLVVGSGLAGLAALESAIRGHQVVILENESSWVERLRVLTSTEFVGFGPHLLLKTDHCINYVKN